MSLLILASRVPGGRDYHGHDWWSLADLRIDFLQNEAVVSPVGTDGGFSAYHSINS